MSDDLTTRARAIWHDMKYEEDPLAALIKALRDERRRALEDVARECERRLDGCNTKGSWSQKVKELVAIKEWCRRQAEAPHG